MPWVTVVAASTMALAVTPPASAVDAPASGQNGAPVTLTLDQDEFLAAGRIKVTETFDEIAAPTEYPAWRKTVAIRGVRYTSLAEERPAWVVDPAGTSSDKLYRRSSLSDVRLAFRNGATTKALGFAVHAFSAESVFRVKVRLDDGRVRAFDLPENQVDRFVGLRSRVGIAKVWLLQSSTAGGTLTNFAFDDVSRGWLRGG